jgi:hypothetical protein
MKVILSSGDIQEPPCELKDAHTVVVKDNFDNPIFVAIHQSNENIWTVTTDDPRFEEIVKNLGITKRLVITESEK